MTKEEFRQLCKVAWKKQHGFVIVDLSSNYTTVHICVSSFTYQTKLKIKTNIIFSLQNGDNKTRFKTWFKQPIQLNTKKDYEITLINLETYYSFSNIDRSNNCFTYSSNLNPLGFDIIISEGSYRVEDINEIIQREMRKMVTMIKQTIRITSKYLLEPTN